MFVLCPPGPGAYNVFDYSMAQDSLRRALLEKNKKGGFGSRAPRNPAFFRREEAPGPGPAQYKVGPTRTPCPETARLE